MDTSKLKTAIKQLQGPLLINHLILLTQLWMLSWQRSAFALGCLAVVIVACGLVWVSVYRRYKQL